MCICLVNRSWVCFSEVNGRLDQLIHTEDIQPVQLLQKPSLLFLAGERVTDEGELEWQPAGCLRVLQLRTVFVVELDDGIDRIPEQEVVVRLVFQLKVVRVKLDLLLHGLALRWCGLFAGDLHLFNWWVHDLLEVWLVVGNELFAPLTLVFNIVNHFKLIQLHVGLVFLRLELC